MVIDDAGLIAGDSYRLLLVVADVQEAAMLWPVADAIVGDRQGQLVIMHVVTVPGEDSLTEGTLRARQSRDALNDFIRQNGRTSAPVKTLVRVGYDVWPDVWEAVEREQIDALVVGWRSETMPQTAIARMADFRLAEPPCDVIVVRLAAGIKGDDWLRGVRQILLPLRGDPGNSPVVRITSALAEAADARISVLHATSHVAHHTEEAWNTSFSYAPDGLPRLNRYVVRTGDAATAIMAEANECQLVVMGTTKWPADSADWSGPVVNSVASGLRTSLITVKEKPGARPFVVTGRAALETAEDRSTISDLVDKWFAQNTYHSEEFADLERLLALKEEQGVTISLGLPALNEEQTVGKVIRAVKGALMDRVPLLDEIVLIDSSSKDHTRAIAKAQGIPVHIHQATLSGHGARTGKGEALWKSLYILQGDIIVWIDTDVHNPDPRFVYGILGPLLRDRDIQFVKGFYRRPIWESGKLRPGGGGRVTELTSRPLFNLFFPELSGLIQPLSGEYAGRRAALDQVPFFCGYGVETGLLIDIFRRFGLGAIAQVDLLERVHRNQSLLSLSKMSFAVIQVIMRRVEERHGVRLIDDVDKTMKLVRYQDEGYLLEEERIEELERPPMIELAEYRQKRGLKPTKTPERVTARENVP